MLISLLIFLFYLRNTTYIQHIAITCISVVLEEHKHTGKYCLINKQIRPVYSNLVEFAAQYLSV